MELWQIYLFVMLDSFGGLITGLTGATFAVTLTAGIFGRTYIEWEIRPSKYDHSTPFEYLPYLKARKLWWIGVVSGTVLGMLLALGNTVLPSTKQAAWIIGGYAATNSEEFMALPENVLKAANDFLEGVDFEHVSNKTAETVEKVGETAEKVGDAAAKVAEEFTE